MSKVFAIGFHKTGTTSLGAALTFLRYRVCHGARPLRRAFGQARMMGLLRQGQYDPLFDAVQEFEAFEDIPWFTMYAELDRRFPGSRFILTRRDERLWIASASRYFGDTTSELREWLYGTGSPAGNERAWLERYRRHEADALQYFQDRPGDLLVVNWEEGDGWPELCRFLDRPMPVGPFPHLNKRAQRGR